MIPVILVKLDNQTGFLGSFDSINWWKTEPLPGAVDFVNDAVWVYGQYHVCSAKMIDGTYSIFQSTDNGFSWESVKSGFTKVGCLVRPDYGVVLAATNDGWWQSINSGTTWSKISTQAPNCFFAREITHEILVALSPTNVWKSTNSGVTWTSVHSFSGNNPTIDGTVYDLLLCVGKTIYYSDNAGTNWYDITYRITNWPSATTYSAITDLEMTSTLSSKVLSSGDYTWSTTDMPEFIIQIKLNNGILRHYHLIRTPGADATENSMMMFTATARFDALSSISNSLISSESKKTGDALVDSLVTFSGTDGSGTKPLIKLSRDGGWTWTDADITNAVIYSGPDMEQLSGGSSMLDGVYFSASWGHGAYCHNYWYVYNTNYQMNQSYDMDMLLYIPVTREQTYTMDVLNQKVRTKTFHADVLFQKVRPKFYLFDALFRSPELFTYSMDILEQKIRPPKQYTMDILELKVCLKTYTSDILNMHFWTELYALDEWVKKVCLKQFGMDVISVFHFTKSFTMDALLLKVCTKNLIMDVLQEGLNIDTYSMDVKIQDTITLDILHNTERYHWQGAAIGIGYPRSSYPIFDSRKETKT